jgi:hypothetical protein
MKIIVLTLAFFLTVFSIRADETKPADEVQIQFFLATVVFDALREEFPEINHIVKAIDLERNCFVLNMGHPDAAKVRETIKTIDRRPQTIRLGSVFSIVSADGREKVLTRPTLFTVNGRTVDFWLGEYDGVKLKLTVTPTLVEE